jgi:aspartyl-tRNA synthetase
MNISSIEMISKSSEDLPFTLDDVNEQYNSKGVCFSLERNSVLMNTRLNNRSFDLRVPFNNCIFKVQSGVTQLFREFLLKRDFMEIHSPQLIGTPSEGGA